MRRFRLFPLAALCLAALAAPATAASQRSEHRPVYSPNGDRILFMSMSADTDGDWELYVMDADGHNARRLTTHEGWDGYAVWSPEGDSILFDRSMTGGNDGKVPIWRDLVTGEERYLGSYEGWLAVNDWSRQDQLLAFWERDGQRDLYLLDLDGRISRRLTDTPKASEHDAHFSPDGRMIAFASETSEGGEERSTVDLLDLPTGARRTIHRSAGRAYGIAWSPDGQSVAFTDVAEGKENADVFLIDLRNGRLERLTDDPAWDHMPDWAPDGKRLLFTSYRTGEERMYALEVASGTVAPVCPSGVPCPEGAHQH